MTKATYNVYCDESCHLAWGEPKGMVLGALWQPTDEAKEVAADIRAIKHQHGLPPSFEIKWSAIYPTKLPFYRDLLDYYGRESRLRFRALVVSDKSKLRHGDFGQTHDTWYYKMHYRMLSQVINRNAEFRIYADFKDTHSHERLQTLMRYLQAMPLESFTPDVTAVQPVRSHEVEQIQLTDLLIGAISYANRGATASRTKLDLVQHLRTITDSDLLSSTRKGADKFNIFVWDAREASNGR